MGGGIKVPDKALEAQNLELKKKVAEMESSLKSMEHFKMLN